MKLYKVLLIVASLIVGFQGIILVVMFHGLPEILPSHYNFLGEIDNFAEKGLLIVEYIIVLSLHLFMCIYVLKMKDLYKKTEKYNINRVYKRDKLILLFVDVVIVCEFFYIFLCTIFERNLGVLSNLIFFILVILIPIIISIKKKE